eukprot:Gregarina_sp_Pseudo_9__966@NODE_161_length_3911_cov_7_085227_g148_i0_p1_GENE_NODE_161_length_3911_cov_7_085227_g148_i0NODE_161_length_3911_cov_7_085227_g148_i0_p1_ORF_typecomplete_len757_score115_51EELM2/PF15863_5/4_7e44PHD/PF00628_29/0_0025PHD/PF00628_29/18zfPHDlike/PF15446_6/0_13zfPHDlike/PF15446_6/2_5e03_NODE_161_length_3911_cov_7_085227_g148_i06292899
MDKPGTATKKRRTPPGVSDDESRHDKKVKVETETSRRQRTLTRAARGRSNAAGDDDTASGTASKITADVPSDHAAPSSDEDKAGTKSAPADQSRANLPRARRAAAARTKHEKELGAMIDTEPRPNRRRTNGAAASNVADSKNNANKPMGSGHMRGNEVDFGHHWRNSKGLSFDTATKVLMMTLKSAKHIDLAEENMQICADCRGGGDLLCCDCCPLAFHADCLEPLERPASLYVPIPKHGLKSHSARCAASADKELADNDDAAAEPGPGAPDEAFGATRPNFNTDTIEERFRLRDSEWFCPYCLSHPIMKLWKRGVPRLLSMFEGFSCVEQEDYREMRPKKLAADLTLKSETGNGDGEMTEDEDIEEDHHHETQHQKANVVEWMTQVEKFVAQPHSVDALFPPRILLALSGIRRAIQRHGALYSAVSKTELERLSEKECVKSPDAVTPPEVLPLADTDEAAEPSVAVKNDVVIKAPIMARRSSSAQMKSDDEQGSTTVKTEVAPRRSTRRAQALAERRAVAAARNAAKPIVREKEQVPDFDEGPVIQAKINVGASFQVPGVNRHFLEAKEFGLDYLIFDKRSVCAYLPMDHMGRIPTARLHLGSGCRLVYSATELQKRQEKILKLKEANEMKGLSDAPLTGMPNVPLSEEQLTEFTRQVISLWPVWIQWPPTQEFALKLLHHCRYDAKAALRLLCSDALQFRAVCDPPVKPYMNKWRPRDRRGHLPSIPFPPPSNAIALMGVGRSHSTGNKTESEI